MEIGAHTYKKESSSNWSFLDIVSGIKNKVKMLLGLKEESKEFVSKEVDLRREAKRQETEFSLSLLVKRFLDFVRGENSIKNQGRKAKGNARSESAKNNKCGATNLLESGQSDLRIDEAVNNN